MEQNIPEASHAVKINIGLQRACVCVSQCPHAACTRLQSYICSLIFFLCVCCVCEFMYARWVLYYWCKICFFLCGKGKKVWKTLGLLTSFRALACIWQARGSCLMWLFSWSFYNVPVMLTLGDHCLYSDCQEPGDDVFDSISNDKIRELVWWLTPVVYNPGT